VFKYVCKLLHLTRLVEKIQSGCGAVVTWLDEIAEYFSLTKGSGPFAKVMYALQWVGVAWGLIEMGLDVYSASQEIPTATSLVKKVIAYLREYVAPKPTNDGQAAPAPGPKSLAALLSRLEAAIDQPGAYQRENGSSSGDVRHNSPSHLRLVRSVNDTVHTRALELARAEHQWSKLLTEVQDAANKSSGKLPSRAQRLIRLTIDVVMIGLDAAQIGSGNLLAIPFLVLNVISVMFRTIAGYVREYACKTLTSCATHMHALQDATAGFINDQSSDRTRWWKIEQLRDDESRKELLEVRKSATLSLSTALYQANGRLSKIEDDFTGSLWSALRGAARMFAYDIAWLLTAIVNNVLWVMTNPKEAVLTFKDGLVGAVSRLWSMTKGIKDYVCDSLRELCNNPRAAADALRDAASWAANSVWAVLRGTAITASSLFMAIVRDPVGSACQIGNMLAMAVKVTGSVCQLLWMGGAWAMRTTGSAVGRAISDAAARINAAVERALSCVFLELFAAVRKIEKLPQKIESVARAVIIGAAKSCRTVVQLFSSLFSRCRSRGA